MGVIVGGDSAGVYLCVTGGGFQYYYKNLVFPVTHHYHHLHHPVTHPHQSLAKGAKEGKEGGGGGGAPLSSPATPLVSEGDNLQTNNGSMAALNYHINPFHLSLTSPRVVSNWDMNENSFLH